MVRAHRQAWTWQDEWFNLTMEDIRELERQTQAALAKKMGSSSATGSFDEQEVAVTEDSTDARTPISPGTGPSWPMSCISESSSSDDDDEFFDCQGTNFLNNFRPSARLNVFFVRLEIQWGSGPLEFDGIDASGRRRIGSGG